MTSMTRNRTISAPAVPSVQHVPVRQRPVAQNTRQSIRQSGGMFGFRR